MLRLGTHRSAIWTSAAAGLAGGLAASWAMGIFHQLLSTVSGTTNEHEGVQDATVQAASAVSEGVFQHRMSVVEKSVAGPAMHFAFGTTMGGLYGALAAGNPVVSAAGGLPFGAAVWAGAHLAAVPALGLSKPPMRKPLAGEAIELASHLVYGAITDGVRRVILRTARS